MKAKILAFIHGLNTYDYILFGSLFVLFLLLLIMTLLLRKRAILASIFLILSFGTLFVAPFVGYIQLHHYLYKNSAKITEVKALEFTPTLIVKGTLKNESKRDFSTCRVQVNVFKVAHNKILDTLFPLNPFQKIWITENGIKKGETRELRIIVEPFTYKKDYNLSLSVDCK